MRNLKPHLLKLLAEAMAVFGATLLIISGYLYLKQSFNTAIFSDWLFVISILYVFIGIVPAYSIITSSNDMSIKFGEHMIKGSMSTEDRVADSKKSFGSMLPLVMIAAGLLCFIASAVL